MLAIRLVLSAFYLIPIVVLSRVTVADIVPISGTITAGAAMDDYPGPTTYADNPPPVVLGSSYGTFSNQALSQFSGVASISLQTTRTATQLTFALSGAEGSTGPTIVSRIDGQIDERFMLSAPADLELLHQHSNPFFQYGVELLNASDQPIDPTGPAVLPAGQYRLRTVNQYPPNGGFLQGMSQLVVLGTGQVPEPVALSLATVPAALTMRRRRASVIRR